MGKLLDLTFYNPALLADDDFLNGFVARRELAGRILARLGEIKPIGLAQHRLIIGQRGMGKTSLLRRIALGVQNTPALAATLVPLTFREEQYNVHNLHVFWCNCLDALGDYYESIGQHNRAEKLDQDVANLDNASDDDEGSQAMAVFDAWKIREGKRPLLLLDNLDLIFDGLKDKQWSLRRFLQKPGGIVAIGASTGLLETTANPKAAFYDFFQVDYLERLDHTELLACLRQLASQRGEAGQKVLGELDRDPARIHVLYDLTGGNPRTLTMLYMILEASDGSDLMRDLDRLLDLATPLYKARVEEFAPQARVVFDVVALKWNPVIAADVARAAGLETNIVSTQLERLHRDGILEKASLSATVRTGFQVAERFFNIWYLMRRAPRRQRSRLRWLTEFLRRFYTPQQLISVATSLIRRDVGEHLSKGTYCLALSDAMEDKEWRDLLLFEAAQELQRHAAKEGVAIDSLVAPEELRFSKNAHEWFQHGWSLEKKVGASHQAESAYRKAIELNPRYAISWAFLGFLLSKTAPRYDEAKEAYCRALQVSPKDAFVWTFLGNLMLQAWPHKAKQAEVCYRNAIKYKPEYASAWASLANFLSKFGHRYDEAEVAYRKAIELDPKSAWPWWGLGTLLAKHLGRNNEAIEPYRRFAEINGKASDWFKLGQFLADKLGRLTEAESPFRKAIEIDPSVSPYWCRLGDLLALLPDRQSDAKHAYRQAALAGGQDDSLALKLAYLLLPRADCRTEAEDYFQQAVAKLPLADASVLRVYRALAHDNFGEAIAGLAKVLEDGAPTIMASGLDNLLRVLRLAKERGYGEKLMAWFDESGLKDRYWPLFAAFDAFLHGAAKLRDVNPEVRGAAQCIFASLDMGRTVPTCGAAGLMDGGGGHQKGAASRR